MDFTQMHSRLFSIRGYPAMMLSDNGTQEVGAQKELCKMIESWGIEKLRGLYCGQRHGMEIYHPCNTTPEWLHRGTSEKLQLEITPSHRLRCTPVY